MRIAGKTVKIEKRAIEGQEEVAVVVEVVE